MIVSLHLALYIIACLCFIVAACPDPNRRYGWQWFGLAALTATLIV